MSIITKMIVNQIGMIIFGLVISMATTQNDQLFLVGSIFSVCFYCFLEYTVAWDLGARDKIRLDGGRTNYTPFKGAFISLAANTLNILLGILTVIGYFMLCDNLVHEAGCCASSLYGVSANIARLIQPIYIGIIQTFSPYNPIIFLLIPIPAIVFSFLGYFVAIKGKSISGMLGISRKNKNKY